MKPGTTVICVRTLQLAGYDFCKIDTIPVKNNVYTVKEIKKSTNPFSDKLLLTFDEIRIGVNTVTGEELGAPMEAFREIEFPPSLELEISESLNRQLQEV